MFENKTEAQAREEILAMVAEYAYRFHNQTKEFSPGDRIPYASRVYDKQEMVNLVDSSLEFWLTSGHTPTSSRRSWQNTFMCGTAPW